MSRRRLDFFCLLEAVEAEGPEEGSEGPEDPDEGPEDPDEGSEDPEDPEGLPEGLLEGPEGPEGLPEGFESSHLDAWSSLDIQVRVV